MNSLISNNQKKNLFFSFLLSFLILFSHLYSISPTITKNETQLQKEMRGVWVATVFNLDYPITPTFSSAELCNQADTILDNAAAFGFNAIFLQVRPCSDALYPSKIFPWSTYLTGEQGLAPDSNLDPLAYWIDGAHSRGMEIHAWINPYRITRSANEWEHLSKSSPAILHPDWVIEYDGNYYFNPALPQVRQLVIDGAVELVDKYEIDGIHMDDYFYPGSDFNDTAFFTLYGKDFTDIGDWRRNNVNLLVEGLDIALHKANPKIEFGISPSGVWASSNLEPDGSKTTTTNSSYRNQYADSKLWVESGWLDYIAPQIYWEIGHETADFLALLDWWSRITEPYDTKLYIGLADYRTVEAVSIDDPWYDGKEIARQMEACHIPPISGTIHFRYGSVADSPALQRILPQAYSSDH